MKNLISASEFVKAVKRTVFIVKNLWKESTTLLLHGSREIDKTAKALDIAAEAASDGRKIVYVACSASLADHADRLTSVAGLSVFRPAYDDPDDSRDYADLVIDSIEEIIKETDIRTFIIDSVSRIAALSFGRNASAAYVMKRLVALQMRAGCSFIIIAHDSTRAADRALLTLADSEITLSDPSANVGAHSSCTSPNENVPCDFTSENVGAHAPCARQSDTNDCSPCDSTKPATPRKQLSRRDRRLLRRKTLQS